MTRSELIARYKDGYHQVADALKDITPEELDFQAMPGKWTCREIIHHLADSEMRSAIRLRRLLAEENPRIIGYDQEEYARKLHYTTRPIGPSLMALQSARESTAQLIDSMTETDWQRTATHSESGAYSPEIWLGIYASHAHNHADQIRRNRKRFSEG